MSATPQRTCAEWVTENLQEMESVTNIKMDIARSEISFDYDPEKLSPVDIQVIAKRISQQLYHVYQTCTLPLQSRGEHSCDACTRHLEHQASNVKGVKRAMVSYLGGIIKVIYDVNRTSEGEIVATLEQHAAPRLIEEKKNLWTWASQRLEVVLTLVAFLTLVGGFIAERIGTSSLSVTLLYLIAYLSGGVFGLKAGLKSLRNGVIDVDFLMVLAAIGAAIVGAPFEGAMLLFLFSLSNVLQNFAMDRTRHAIRALMQLRPNIAEVKRGNKTIHVPVEQVNIDDIFIVRPGDRLPLDGVVVRGESAINQAPITGESIPVTKRVNDVVLAGTINQTGNLEVRVTKLAKDSTLAKLVQLVEEARSEKAKTQRFLDRAEQAYARGVILFTLLVTIIPIAFLGESFDSAFYRAMTLMVAASPCALVISTPASILSAIGNGARRGILFKGGVYVEQAASIKAIAFDKTGTLTIGQPRVTDVQITSRTWEGAEADLLRLAATVEAKSEHPLAKAILKAATEHHVAWEEADAFQSVAGRGVEALVEGKHIRVGSCHFFEPEHLKQSPATQRTLEQFQHDGKTSIIVAEMNQETGQPHLLGVIAVADIIRPEAKTVVQELKSLGIKNVTMLTGDNRHVAQAISKELGVDGCYAELLPEDKLRIINQLKSEYGPVCMVGDGVNDAPALATASIGIAMGAAGTDVALETADIVLMSDNLKNIPYVIALSHQTRKTLMLNLGFAAGMILIMIAAILGWDMSLPLAVIGHEGGTVLVSLNGLRLLGYHR